MKITEDALKSVKQANDINSLRIFGTENSLVRKDFEREERSLLVIKINETITNLWKAATHAKETQQLV
jgi:hypothetical protein